MEIRPRLQLNGLRLQLLSGTKNAPKNAGWVGRASRSKRVVRPFGPHPHPYNVEVLYLRTYGFGYFYSNSNPSIGIQLLLLAVPCPLLCCPLYKSCELIDKESLRTDQVRSVNDIAK